MSPIFHLFFCLLISIVNCCQYNPESHAATCYTYQNALTYAKPEWTSLTIKNEGYQNLTNLGKHFFKKVPNLTKLVLNGIANRLGPNSFQSTRKLEWIQMKDNQIETIPGTIFKNLDELRNVYITSSGVKFLGRGTFQGLEKLRLVCLRNNSFKVFPKDVVSSTNIEELYLEDNGMEKIEELAFINMPKLRKVNFSGNKLKTLDVPSLFGTNSLKLDRLAFGNNALEKIEKNTFELLPNLKYLFLEQNKINFIEDSAFKNLQKLVSLDLSDNELQEISPNTFPKEPMEHLELFLLHNNRFTFIDPEVLSRMPKLKYLTYFGNPFQCPCLDQLNNILSGRNLTQICYDNKENRPLCLLNIINDIPLFVCSYDLEENKNLYGEYLEKMKNWMPWSKKCQFAEGYEHIQWSSYSS